MALSLAGCGALDTSGDSTNTRSDKGNDITVGVLMPEKTNTRYIKFDYPIIQKKVAALTQNRGKTVYANGNSDTAEQAAQMQRMIDEKVDVILLDAVDSHAIAPMVKKAKDADIPVIAYDRLAEGPIDAYVSFDNELVGEVQGRSLIQALGSGTHTSDRIVMVNGSPTDPNAKLFKVGALSEISNNVIIAKSYDTRGYSPQVAQSEMDEAIKAIGKGNIAAVYSANDAMAARHHQVPEGRGRHRVPAHHRPGRRTAGATAHRRRRAVHDGLQAVPGGGRGRCRSGRHEDTGARIQFDALTFDKVDSPTNENVSAQLVSVSALTRENIKETVIADGFYTVDQICTAKYKAACAAIALN